MDNDHLFPFALRRTLCAVSDDWDRGERQGVRWGRLGAAVLVLAIVAGGVYVIRHRNQLAVETGEDGPVVDVSESVDVVGTAPLQAGDRWYCPSTFPVGAYEDGFYRPPEYPRDTGVDRPEQCYADSERAESEGYDLAPPPGDVVLAGGVYLEPTRTPSDDACADLATSLGFTVPCPTRLPVPADGPSCQMDSCTYGDFSGVVIEHRHFRVPADWPDDVQPQVIVTAVPRRRLQDESVEYPTPELVACRLGDPVEVNAQPLFVQCPPGDTWIPRIQGDPHEEHTAAFWRKDDVVYGASVEGHTDAAEALLHALIDGIEYVPPRPP